MKGWKRGMSWKDTGRPWASMAPNLRSPALSTPGFVIEPARFTPRASAFAVNPKHTDAECVGGRVSVRDAAVSRPYELGLQLLGFLHAQPGFAWTGPTALDDLVGTSRLRRALDSGETVAQIHAADAAANEKFRKDRVRFLLY